MSSRPFLALLGAAVILLAASCVNERNAAGPEDALDQRVCNESDLGAGYHQKTEGDFTPGNLADLSGHADKRRKELEAAGLSGGRFAYWKHTVPHPPFDAPLEVVCQAMRFASDAEARQFVADLRPEAEDLATTAITWLPGGDRSAHEEAIDEAGLEAGARGFRLEARGDYVNLTLFAVVVPSGPYVRSVYVGDTEDDTATLADAEDIQARIGARLR